MRALGRFFSGRDKSPVRVATEMAVLGPVLVVVIYAPRGEAVLRLAVGALGVAAIFFVCGFAIGLLNKRQRHTT